MNNEPVAWTDKRQLSRPYPHSDAMTMWANAYPEQGIDIPLYTHPVKELHLSLQKSKQTGELLAVTYTDDEHRIVEVLWQKPPVKELFKDESFERTASGNSVLVPSDKLAEMQAEIEALKAKAHEWYLIAMGKAQEK